LNVYTVILVSFLHVNIIYMDKNEVVNFVISKKVEDMAQLNLMIEEIETIYDLATQIIISPSEDHSSFCNVVKKLSEYLPERIKQILCEFKEKGSTTGCLLFNNLFFDNNLSETPINNKMKIGEKTIIARVQALFMSILGEMISYEAEGYGDLFQDIIPVKSMSNFQTSVSSNTELEIHTEQCFSQLRPDILSLACLRGDLDALTYILPVKYIIDNLSIFEIALLREPLWMIGVDLSFKLNGNEFKEGDKRGPFPILYGNLDDPFLLFDQDLMTGVTEEANSIIIKIVDIYYNYRLKYNLSSGQIIFIDNNRAVHGRSPFFPKFDGYDRFLIRSFATFDYSKSDNARENNSRMIRAIYS